MSSSGACILCQCNGHSTDCDPVTGQCQVCFSHSEVSTCSFNDCYRTVKITQKASIVKNAYHVTSASLLGHHLCVKHVTVHRLVAGK